MLRSHVDDRLFGGECVGVSLELNLQSSSFAVSIVHKFNCQMSPVVCTIRSLGLFELNITIRLSSFRVVFYVSIKYL